MLAPFLILTLALAVLPVEAGKVVVNTSTSAARPTVSPYMQMQMDAQLRQAEAFKRLLQTPPPPLPRLPDVRLPAPIVFQPPVLPPAPILRPEPPRAPEPLWLQPPAPTLNIVTRCWDEQAPTWPCSDQERAPALPRTLR
ncbi:MAG: hypothetical protein ABIO70_15535 [Pseudomonadota bacterium]